MTVSFLKAYRSSEHLFTTIDLADLSQLLFQIKVDYMRGNTHFIAAHFILECCKKLEAKVKFRIDAMAALKI